MFPTSLASQYEQQLHSRQRGARDHQSALRSPRTLQTHHFVPQADPSRLYHRTAEAHPRPFSPREIGTCKYVNSIRIFSDIADNNAGTIIFLLFKKCDALLDHPPERISIIAHGDRVDVALHNIIVVKGNNDRLRGLRNRVEYEASFA